MGVFLRWGVFGIITVAALVYAYNANKRLAEQRRPAVVSQVAGQEDEQELPEPELEPGEPPMAEHCQVELRVAQRALEASAGGEPLDRVLRHPAITFEDDEARRQQLEKVANRWYVYGGDELSPAALRRAVRIDCRVNPAP